jgi:pimeloyl-ACP methyl ester carboxylesterase
MCHDWRRPVAMHILRSTMPTIYSIFWKCTCDRESSKCGLHFNTDTKKYRIFEKHDGNKCRDILPSVHCAVLVMHGDKDPLVADEHPKYLCRMMPRARWVQTVRHTHDYSQMPVKTRR